MRLMALLMQSACMVMLSWWIGAKFWQKSLDCALGWAKAKAAREHIVCLILICIIRYLILVAHASYMTAAQCQSVSARLL